MTGLDQRIHPAAFCRLGGGLQGSADHRGNPPSCQPDPPAAAHHLGMSACPSAGCPDVPRTRPSRSIITAPDLADSDIRAFDQIGLLHGQVHGAVVADGARSVSSPRLTGVGRVTWHPGLPPVMPSNILMRLPDQSAPNVRSGDNTVDNLLGVACSIVSALIPSFDLDQGSQPAGVVRRAMLTSAHLASHLGDELPVRRSRARPRHHHKRCSKLFCEISPVRASRGVPGVNASAPRLARPLSG